jgi:uncharacterized protein (DUF433 family)
LPFITKIATFAAMNKNTYPIPGVPVWQNPERVSGALCFDRTRLPVSTLFDYLEHGSTLDEFLDCFEGVSREQALAVLNHARRSLLTEPPLEPAA